METVKIAVLASGGGSNLQALIDAQADSAFNGEIALVVSNRKAAFALERAKKAGIATHYLSSKSFPTAAAFDDALLTVLAAHEIDFIVLAGYLKVLSAKVLQSYPNKIINIHPSLLPAFGGDGFYGMRVHHAVHQSGAKLSGATVHFVTEGIDAGPIILQKAIRLEPDWGPEDIQAAVLKLEHPLLVEAVKLYCENRLEITDNKVLIREF